jgi:hypothetical protein
MFIIIISTTENLQKLTFPQLVKKFRLLRNSKAHYRTHNSPPLEFLLRQFFKILLQKLHDSLQTCQLSRVGCILHNICDNCFFCMQYTKPQLLCWISATVATVTDLLIALFQAMLSTVSDAVSLPPNSSFFHF